MRLQNQTGYDLFLLGCWINVILITMLSFRNTIITLIRYTTGGLFYNLSNIILRAFSSTPPNVIMNLILIASESKFPCQGKHWTLICLSPSCHSNSKKRHWKKFPGSSNSSGKHKKSLFILLLFENRAIFDKRSRNSTKILGNIQYSYLAAPS